MTQKPKLEPGQRVRVYSGTHPTFTGTITDIRKNGMLGVTEDGFYSEHDACPFHPYQVRKLRPKQKPEKERSMANDFEAALSYIASGGGPIDETLYSTWDRADMMNYARKTLNRWGKDKA